MNDTIVGILYIIVALLIVVVKYAVPQFFDILIWLIAIGLAATGVYFIMRRRWYYQFYRLLISFLNLFLKFYSIL